jgi:cation diffusion facilitator CzcD-associated flavoprotein CzcO
MHPATAPDHHTVIVGAGFSGIGAAVKLDEAGLTDYLVIEAADALGGTWHWNTYPGVAVDIPSFSYQFSFEPWPDWSRTYAHGHELKAYAEHCAGKYGIRPKIRFNTTVVRAVFDDRQHLWRLYLESGEQITTRFLVNAAGAFNTPNYPDIAGVDDFAGITMHTARWDHSQTLTGKRVAVIGTGASAVQVIPEIAPKVAQLKVFQRTAIWCFPKPDVALPRMARAMMRFRGGMAVQRLLSNAYVEVTLPLPAHYSTTLKFTKRAEAAGRSYLRRQVRDVGLREKLTPNYVVGCKRPGFHNSYLSTFNRDNVELVTDPIARITNSAVVTVTEELREVDVLILATGFKVMDFDSLSYEVVGRDGLRLSRFWERNRMQAYEGVTVPGFPNYFTVVGPYGFIGGSWFSLIETQTHHILRCLQEARRLDATQVEIRETANTRYFDEMMRKRHTQVFWHDSCELSNSYYFDSNGDVPVRRASTPEIVWRSHHFPLDDYRFSNADAVT